MLRPKNALRARKRSQIWLFAGLRLALARLARVLHVGQKQRVQAAAAREEIRHARKKHVHVAAKVAMPRARMTNADAAVKVVQRRAAKAVRLRVVKVVPHRVVKVVPRREAKVDPLHAKKVVPLRAAKVAPLPAAKAAPLHAKKVAPLLAAKVAPRLVARVAMERGWKLPLVVAVTRSHRLRAADQPSHRVHPDR